MVRYTASISNFCTGGKQALMKSNLLARQSAICDDVFIHILLLTGKHCYFMWKFLVCHFPSCPFIYSVVHKSEGMSNQRYIRPVKVIAGC